MTQLMEAGERGSGDITAECIDGSGGKRDRGQALLEHTSPIKGINYTMASY